jgi:hypothetical protein
MYALSPGEGEPCALVAVAHSTTTGFVVCDVHACTGMAAVVLAGT